jgi:hypothetical protein
MPAIDEMDEKSIAIEAEALHEPKRETLVSIMQLKRAYYGADAHHIASA